MLAQVQQAEGAEVLLFADECTFHCPPSQGYLWHAMGRRQPPLRYRGDHCGIAVRTIGFLDASTAAVHADFVAQATVEALSASVAGIIARYPQAEKLYLVWDNWPPHHHPAVAATLARYPQVQLVPLPTYSPWLNPIEKLWRYLRQRVTHGHSWAELAGRLRQQLSHELAALANGSLALLKYVGLSI